MTVFFTLDLLVRLVMSFLATMGFAIMFKTPPRHLAFAGLSGVITYFVYIVVEVYTGQLFLAAFISTTAVAVLCEIYARISKSPAIIVLSSSVIPTVPGGSLYYTAQHIMTGEFEEAMIHLGNTVSIGLGIACGIVIVSLASKGLTEFISERRKKLTTSKTYVEDSK